MICAEVAHVLALNLLPIGHAAVISELALPDAVEHHLMHMGFSPEARVLAVRCTRSTGWRSRCAVKRRAASW